MNRLFKNNIRRKKNTVPYRYSPLYLNTLSFENYTDKEMNYVEVY